ncbi:hypothetical protein HPG69_001393 [Diceros bicornis minor]|uniref:C-X-C motif chemokine n=1 Tax=Diceros bicornis minor TaxID=77932 RepID=A0A7J7FFC4_DICBM|nr:hypothetical protein HPG69_001393 [Diceros bicornis minor]
MSLRPKATSSCSSASPLWVLRVLLPLSLLLTALVPSIAIREPTSVDRELYVELRCLCLQTTSGVHPSKIQSLKVMRAGPHCHKVEVIATLLNGDEICLDPEDLRLRKIIQKILKTDPEGGDGDLRCVCAKTSSQVRPKQVNSLEVIRAGVYCRTPQLIATMRNGRKTCVDPQAPVYKKIIKKILESQLSAA